MSDYILLIASVEHGYILGKAIDANIEIIAGTDNSFFFAHYDELFKNTKPVEIYVMRGPGSFTNLRFILLAARVLAIMYGIKFKSCTLFDMIQECIADDDLQIVVGTGTRLVLRHHKNNMQLMELGDLDFTNPWTTYLDWNTNIKLHDSRDYIDLERFINWPDNKKLMSAMYRVCQEKNEYETDDLQPMYSIHPHYLKTESEV